MATDSEVPQPIARLSMTHFNIRNTSFISEDSRLHFDVVTNAHWYALHWLTRIYRTRQDGTRELLVEWERHTIQRDRVKLLQWNMDQFVPLKDMFPVTWGASYSDRLSVYSNSIPRGTADTHV